MSFCRFCQHRVKSPRTACDDCRVVEIVCRRDLHRAGIVMQILGQESNSKARTQNGPPTPATPGTRDIASA
jgi:hypothetical protein